MASKKQAPETDEIAGGLNQIDHVTQQNRAHVEKAVSSAQGLSHQAAGLQKLTPVCIISSETTDLELLEPTARVHQPEDSVEPH